MVEQIRSSDYAQICLVVANDLAPEPTPATAGIVAKLSRSRGRIFQVVTRKLLHIAYSLLIERRTSLLDSDQPKDLSDLLVGIPVIHAQPVRRKWSDRYAAKDLRHIAEFDVDVLVRLGSRILRGGILEAARYGVWSYHHADNRLNRGGPAGFWESMQGWPETGCVLQILTEDLDNGTVLYRSYSCTVAMSVLDNRRNYFWKSLAFLPRTLRRLHALGSEEFFRHVAEQNPHPTIYSRKLYVKPSNAEYARLLACKVFDKVKLRWHSLRYRPQWTVLYDLKPEMSSSLWRYKRMVPPKDRFWADPFPVEWKGCYYVFIEECIFATGKGHISVITIDAAGNRSEPVVVLDRPYHLSYPFVFRHEGAFYMIPESAQNSTIELYRCVDFPYVWEFQENLMTDIMAYDATMTFHEGKYWLFANVVDHPGVSSWDELFVFYSDRPFGAAWTPHPMNPVVSDCKSARPGGAMFSMDGKLYRTAQDCSIRYGYGFAFARIDALDEHTYREVVVSRASPDWADDVLATHTFNRAGALNVIDAQIRRAK